MAKPPGKDPKQVFEFWRPAPYDLADVHAMQNLAQGTATKDQQIRALKWIVETASRVYDGTYSPLSPRDSDFAAGMRWVGLQIVKLTKLQPGKVKKDAGPPTENG